VRTSSGILALAACLKAKPNGPTGVAVDGAGNVYVADTANDRIRRVGTDGIITTIAGTGAEGYTADGVPVVTVDLHGPTALAVAADGTVYVVEYGGGRVRKILPSGTLVTVAGQEYDGFNGDGGPATAAQFNGAFGVAVDAAGNVYFADLYNHRVRKIVPAVLITTVAGSGDNGFSGDLGVATDARLNSRRGSRSTPRAPSTWPIRPTTASAR